MKKFRCSKVFFWKYYRTLTKRSTPFSDTCLKFVTIFCKIVIIFLGINTTSNKFLDINKAIKSCGTVVEVHQYELGAINVSLIV